MVHLHNLCKWEAGPREGRGGHTTYLKINKKFNDPHFFHFCLNTCLNDRHVQFEKIKSSFIRKHIFCLVLKQNLAAKTILSSLNISGVKKCKYCIDTKCRVVSAC